ncbi:MAG: permease-like cell division protein FtsX [Kofleriaceae bacterium]
MITRLRSALARTARIATERPRAMLWTLLAMTCALFAVGIAVIAARNVTHWTAERPHGTASMVVYLAEGTTDARASELVGQLRSLQGVERADLVPAVESSRRLVGALGADAAMLEGIDLASLPASVEVTLAPGVRDVVAMSPTVRALRGAPGVAELVVDDRGEQRVSSSLGAVRWIAWAAAALFSGLALMTVLASIRVRLDRGDRELAVAELLGAGPGFTVVPTALAGALQGVAAALISLLGLAVVVHLYGPGVTETLSTVVNPVELVTPSALELVAFVGGGALLGFVGGALAGASRVAR